MCIFYDEYYYSNLNKKIILIIFFIDVLNLFLIFNH